jgi:hypothetical protein
MNHKIPVRFNHCRLRLRQYKIARVNGAFYMRVNLFLVLASALEIRNIF